VVACQSPERNLDRIYASHPDHLAAGEAAICAVYPDSRNPFAFPALLEDGLEPWTVDEVWVMGHPGGVDYIDITAQIDRKIEALLCHESQHADPDRTEALVREWGRALGAAAGLPEGSAAELFRVVNTR
jgi:LmbE family N-acetylglucosaminyl deacetylase